MVIKMNEDIELLNFIYQNAKMGIVGIDNIKSSIKDKELLKLIKEQENDYYAICTKAIKYLSLSNSERKNVNMMAKAMTYMDAKKKLMKDSSSSNIAKMMMEGNNIGIIAITEKLNNYKDVNKKIVKLAKDLLKIEQRNLENLKQYL